MSETEQPIKPHLVTRDLDERTTLKEAVLRPRPPRERAAILIACALHVLRGEDRRQMQVALYALRRAFRFLSGEGPKIDPWTWAQERVRPTETPHTESGRGPKEEPPPQGDVQ